MRIDYHLLRNRVEAHFRALGLSPEHARCVSEVLLEAEAEGNFGHGLIRIAQYTAQLKAGGLNPKPQMYLEKTSLGVTLLHADGAPGPVAGLYAVEVLKEQIKRYGIAVLAVRDAGHAGALSAYVGRLAQAGNVGIAFANTPPALAPGPLLGTNPIAFGAPAEPYPVIVDTSLSQVSRGKIIAAAKKGEPLPPGWAVDREGRPTTNALAALEGALLPIGGGKGYALAIMVEILAGVLAGAVISSELQPPWGPPEAAARPGLLLLGMDPSAFGKGYEERMAHLVHALEAVGGRIPGWRRALLRERALREGVVIENGVLQELVGLGVLPQV